MPLQWQLSASFHHLIDVDKNSYMLTNPLFLNIHRILPVIFLFLLYLAPSKDTVNRRVIGTVDIEEKGEYVAVRSMRKHIGWYVKGMHGAVAVRRNLNELECAADIIEGLERLVKEEV